MKQSDRDRKAVRQLDVIRFSNSVREATKDDLTCEEPVELVVEYGPVGNRKRKRISVNLLTPGCEEEWGMGLLFAEGLIGNASQVAGFDFRDNQLVVNMHPGQLVEIEMNLDRLERRLAATASCGFCGKENLGSLSWEPAWYPAKGKPVIEPAVLYGLQDCLLEEQAQFVRTGGLHAAALFEQSGKCILAREDVGRHNALDKLLGAALLQDLMPLRNHIILLSGRIGFELVQKASMAGVPILAAVGAPSDLAVQSAEISGMTLIGFLRDNSFNCYCAPERLARSS